MGRQPSAERAHFRELSGPRPASYAYFECRHCAAAHEENPSRVPAPARIAGTRDKFVQHLRECNFYNGVATPAPTREQQYEQRQRQQALQRAPARKRPSDGDDRSALAAILHGESAQYARGASSASSSTQGQRPLRQAQPMPRPATHNDYFRQVQRPAQPKSKELTQKERDGLLVYFHIDNNIPSTFVEKDMTTVFLHSSPRPPRCPRRTTSVRMS